MSLTLEYKARVEEFIGESTQAAKDSLWSAPAKTMDEYQARVAGITAYHNCLNVIQSVWDEMTGTKQEGNESASANN